MRLEEGANPIVYESQSFGDDEVAQVLVTLWVEDGKVDQVDVALRPYRGATWGVPLRRTGGG